MKKIWTNLKKSPEFYKDTIELIEDSFNYSKEYSFENDFKPLLDTSNRQNCHILINEDNLVIAHIAVIKRQIKKNLVSTPACIIGGIVVNPEFRGQGIFKDFFTAILDLYKEDCSFFLLWSEKNILYEKFNFYEFGKILQVDIKNDATSFKALPFNELSENQLEQIKSIHHDCFEDYIHPIRSNSDWSILRTQNQITCLVDDYDNISKYALIDKGFDLNGVIHECSFIRDSSAINNLPTSKLWLPEDCQEDIKHSLDIYAGTIRLNSNQLTRQFIEEIFDGDLKVKDLSDETICFTFKNQIYNLEINEFITLCFGPNPADEFIPYGNYFYIPGLDSI